MHISARADYALRAMLAIADAHPERLTTPQLAEAEGIPLGYLQVILVDLRRLGFLYNRRGIDPGYELARSDEAITVGEVLRATEGSLTTVRGLPACEAGYEGVARGLGAVWISVDAAVHHVVDRATLRDVLNSQNTAYSGMRSQPIS